MMVLESIVAKRETKHKIPCKRRKRQNESWAKARIIAFSYGMVVDGRQDIEKTIQRPNNGVAVYMVFSRNFELVRE